jgi:modulator of FtsH protease
VKDTGTAIQGDTVASSGELGIFTPNAGARSTTASLLLGQVMFLVAVALGFFALGCYVGRDLSYGTGLICEIGAIAMLFAQAFVPPLRTGMLAIGWLYALALLLGIGLGPIVNYYTTYDPTVLYQAAGGTALTVAGMGAFGFATSRDLVRWARPLFWGFLVVILASWILVLFSSGGDIVLSLAIYVFASAFLAINFQYLRRRADADDAVWIATGIFINIVNIFLALLRIFGSSR